MEEVILVDKNDTIVGTMEKLEAHQKGLLHRAFSVLLFNSSGQLLLQKRSIHKYHSAGLWTNACCSHPQPGEKMEDATRRRLSEEMGIDLQPEFVYKFIYKTNLDKGLIEYEYDHVFTGVFDGVPAINAEEVEDWKLIDLKSLQHDILKHPEAYTYWFKLIIQHPEFLTIAGEVIR